MSGVGHGNWCLLGGRESIPCGGEICLSGISGSLETGHWIEDTPRLDAGPYDNRTRNRKLEDDKHQTKADITTSITKKTLSNFVFSEKFPPVLLACWSLFYPLD